MPTEEITAAVFARDSKLVTVGDNKGFIHLLDGVSGRTVRKWQAHPQHVLALHYSQDDKVLASCSSDNKVCLWNPESGKKLHEIVPLGGLPMLRAPLGIPLSPIVFVLSPGGKTLAVGSRQRAPFRQNAPAFELWNVANGERLALNAPAPSGEVFALAFSRDGRKLASLSENGVIALWDVESRRRLDLTAGHERAIGQLAVFADGKRLATMSGNSIRVWDLATAREQDRIDKPGLRAMALAPDSGQLAAVTLLDAFVWNPKSKQTTNLPFQSRAQFNGLAYAPDGTKLALIRLGQVQLVDTRTWRLIWTNGGRAGFSGAASGPPAGLLDAVFSPDGTFVATAGTQGQISLWNAADGKWLRDLDVRVRAGAGKSRPAKGGKRGGGFPAAPE